MMTPNRLAITGIGLIDNLGSNPEECFQSYISDQSPICVDGQFTSVDTDLLKPDMRAPAYASLVKANKLALHVVEQALTDVPHSENVFTIFSTLSAMNEHFSDYAMDISDGGNRIKPKTMLQGLKDYISGLIPILYNFTGGSVGFNSACSTSLYQLDYAFTKADEYDYIICGASETANNEWDMHFFRKLGAIGSKSIPFSEQRDGFVMGEGAACLVLEKPEKAINRGAKIYGYIHKPVLANDGSAGNVVAPSNVGVTKTMTPFKDYNLSFVSAHATSTPAGDELEYNTIQSIFPGVPVTSFKSKIGHTLGASGVVEVVYTLMALKNNIIPKTDSYDGNLNNVVRQNIYSNKSFALKNSLGFGGKCASVVIETP